MLPYTDLSFEAVKYAKSRYQASSLGKQHPTDCEFHAVNAYYLPFYDHTFDIICADGVIHHMDDLWTLFAGVYRCLKPGGICRFADTAYWPGYGRARKRKSSMDIQKYVHKKQGISSEDKKATDRGGCREELEEIRARLGFKNLYYKRVALHGGLIGCLPRQSWRSKGSRWFLDLGNSTDRKLFWISKAVRLSHACSYVTGTSPVLLDDHQCFLPKLASVFSAFSHCKA